MTNFVDIANALLTRAALLETDGPELPVAMPDIAFEPPADGKYLRATVFYNTPAWEGLGPKALAQGLLQITVVWPRGVGIIEALSVAEIVKQEWPKGLTLRQNSTTIKINKAPWSGSPIEDEGMTLVPVSISWSAS